MKESINPIKNSIEITINSLDHLEVGTSDKEHKIYTLKNKVNHPEKMEKAMNRISKKYG